MPDVLKAMPVTQNTPFEELSRFISLIGKDVLEIGGNSKCVSAIPFIKAGAEKVTVSGLGHVEAVDKSPHEKIDIVTADALEISHIFGPQSFDIVYGVSILEHIPNPDRLFAQVFRVLRPGGIAYLQGGPVWTSAYGHHIWLDAWCHHTSKSYHFIPWPGSDAVNPIPDWAHLLYNPIELSEILLKDGRLPDDVKKIVEFIYKSNVINREGFRSIMRAVSTSPLLILNAALTRYVVPPNVLNRLRQLYPNELDDWSVSGVGLVLLKL